MERLPLLRTALAAVGMILLTAGVFAAEAVDAPNIVSYQPEFYASAQPNTAFDMVRRTPGFTYQAGEQNVRGLTGALGNVLIDGQTQTSKAVTLDEVLQRIPASQVARIDIVRGGAEGIDMAGFAVVANIVRVAGGGSEVAVELEPRVYSEDHPVDGDVRLDWSRHVNDLVLSGTIAGNSHQADEHGIGRISRIGSTGALLTAGDFLSNRRRREIAANGALEYRSGDTLYRASFGVELANDQRDDQARVSTLERFLVDEDSEQGEISFNVERKFSAAWTGRLDVVQNYESETSLSGRSGSLEASEARTGESNLRATLVLRKSNRLGLEFGAEGAFNFLDQSSTLTASNANVRVEELRIQPFATMNWQVAPRFALESGVRYETSTISQSGDTESERRFDYLKPRLLAVFDLLEGTQLRLGYEHDVRQLDFQDFAASNGQTEGENVSGNASLRPERAWVSSVAVEQRLWSRSAIVLTYTHEAVRDAWDYIPIGPTADGTGNAGDATRDTLEADIKIALDPLGIRGGRLEANPQYYLSEIVDPFTGMRRQISEARGWRGRASLFLDRPGINSTFAIERIFGFHERAFRIDQVVTTIQQPFFIAWWEWSPRPSLSLRATVNPLTSRQRDRNRQVYTGSRGAGVLAFHEERYVRRDTIFSLRIRKSFL